ncbi:DNA cytosine methyltransferase [Pseudochrobactrum sp. B5]|uniref:DNA cytosine methyltransferase n=1 Tax=Pseudochrobactrum sp. B5 TaxID=1289478 RepID=UPI0009FA027F|nr:DNA cytosine methyltransferase [Pseudochrobactrum sp. B5]
MSDPISRILTQLSIDTKTLSTILNLGPNGEDKLAFWRENPSKMPKKEAARLQLLRTGIPHRSQAGTFKFIDLFAGIGGMRLPFQELGGQCVFTAEWDRHAQATYAANFGEPPYKTGDITATKACDIAAHDILLAGFPCQAFSQAGRRAGFHDTRGTMFFEIQRILAHHHPAAFLLENVKQLKGHDSGRTLETILSTLRGDTVPNIPDKVPMSVEARQSLGTKLDYETETILLKARDFGVPQNRERIYIVGIRRDLGLPFGSVRALLKRVVENYQQSSRLSDILEADSDYTRSFTISDRLWLGHRLRKERNRLAGKGFGYSIFNHESAYTNTISARYAKDGSEILIEQPDGINPRKLTPEETRALQGFPRNFRIDMVGNGQIYKQFGNSVAVPVIRAIATELMATLRVAHPPLHSKAVSKVKP